jgi:hypothetical protein
MSIIYKRSIGERYDEEINLECDAYFVPVKFLQDIYNVRKDVGYLVRSMPTNTRDRPK